MYWSSFMVCIDNAVAIVQHFICGHVAHRALTACCAMFIGIRSTCQSDETGGQQAHSKNNFA